MYKYNYWVTTGRWLAKYAWKKEAYYSKGIEDFVTNYLNRFANNTEYEQSHYEG